MGYKLTITKGFAAINFKFKKYGEMSAFLSNAMHACEEGVAYSVSMEQEEKPEEWNLDF